MSTATSAYSAPVRLDPLGVDGWQGAADIVAAAGYTLEDYDFTASTPVERTQIQHIYDLVFREDIGLVFDPTLDADFQNPLKYYAPGVRGAFVVIRDFVETLTGDTVVALAATAAAESPATTAATVTKAAAPDTAAPVEAPRKGAATVTVTAAPAVNTGHEEHTNITATTHAHVTAAPVPPIMSVSCGSSPLSQEPIKVEGSCRGGRIVGVCALRNMTTGALPNTAELKRMFFLPECRGKSLAVPVVARILAHARRFEYAKVILDTKKKLEAANHVYEAFGWADCEDYNANPRADRWMRLDVAKPTS